MNYYSTLNVPSTASADDIKKAYRKLAKTHHPDTGGDENKFKQITEAYNILSDHDKRRLVDRGIDPAAPGNGNYYNVNTGNLHDIFANFAEFQHKRPRNKSINIGVELTLEEVLTGKNFDANIGLPGREHKIINITMPTGVGAGQRVTFRELGDDSIPYAPPGDLIVSVFVHKHNTFTRDRETLFYEKHISVWDAILGTTITVPTLDQKELKLKVPAGTQANTVFKCKEHGLPMLNTTNRGNLLVRLTIDTPTNLSDKHLEMVNLLQKENNDD